MKVTVFLILSTWCTLCSATTVCQVQKMILTSSGQPEYSDPWVDAISWDEKTGKASVHKQNQKLEGDIVLDRVVSKGVHNAKNLVFSTVENPDVAFEVVVNTLNFGDETSYSLYVIQTISVDETKFLDTVIEKYRSLECTVL